MLDRKSDSVTKMQGQWPISCVMGTISGGMNMKRVQKQPVTHTLRYKYHSNECVGKFATVEGLRGQTGG